MEVLVRKFLQETRERAGYSVPDTHGSFFFLGQSFGFRKLWTPYSR